MGPEGKRGNAWVLSKTPRAPCKSAKESKVQILAILVGESSVKEVKLVSEQMESRLHLLAMFR